MKFLVIGRPVRVDLPLEHRLAIFKASNAWHEKCLKDGTFDCIYNFPDGGGMSINNLDSIEAVYDSLIDYPGGALFDFEVTPLLDNKHAGEKAVSRMEQAIEKRKQKGL